MQPYFILDLSLFTKSFMDLPPCTDLHHMGRGDLKKEKSLDARIFQRPQRSSKFRIALLAG